MAGITAEMLVNMMRTTLGGLKNFAEMLNAELSEEIEDAQNRTIAKETFVDVLNKFGDSEAVYEKGIRCLKDTERNVNTHFQMEDIGHVSHEALRKEILSLIKTIEGKDNTTVNENEESFSLPSVDENKIVQQLENVEDILNEFHPLKFREDEEDDNSNEEERASKRLEKMLRKAMKKMKNRMDAVHEDDDEFAATLNANDDFSVSEDEEQMDCENLERPVARSSGIDDNTRKKFDAKLNQMWTEYQENLKDTQIIDVKKTYDEMFKAREDVERRNLPFFSKFNESILDLFTGEAIFVLRNETNYVDPISKKDIINPVRNRICDHIYDKDVIFSILRKKKEMACPLLGCSCKSFKLADLEEDDELTATVSQSLAKKQTLPLSQDDTNFTEETLNDDDDDDLISVRESVKPSTSNDRSRSLEESESLPLSQQEPENMEVENQEDALLDDDDDDDDAGVAESQELF